MTPNNAVGRRDKYASFDHEEVESQRGSIIQCLSHGGAGPISIGSLDQFFSMLAMAAAPAHQESLPPLLPGTRPCRPSIYP